MATLKVYSEKEIEYDRYRRRELFLHDEASWRKMHAEEEKLRKEAQQRSIMLEEDNNQLAKENERLLALLTKADIDPK